MIPPCICCEASQNQELKVLCTLCLLVLRSTGPRGDTLYTHLHQPLLKAWPYLITALRQSYKGQAANHKTTGLSLLGVS